MYIQINKVDADGFIIEPVIFCIWDVLQVDEIRDEVPQELYVPRWNYESKTWGEGATEEFIQSIKDKQLETEQNSGHVIFNKIQEENKRLNEELTMQAMAIFELASMIMTRGVK